MYIFLLVLFYQEWCRENFINHRNVKHAVEVRKQLRELCVRASLPLQSCGHDFTTIRWLSCDNHVTVLALSSELRGLPTYIRIYFFFYFWSMYYRDMRVQSLITDFLLFTKPNFQTFNAVGMHWKAHLFRHFILFQTFSHRLLSHPLYENLY